MDGEETFLFLSNRTPNSGVKGSGANHYSRAPAQKSKDQQNGEPVKLPGPSNSTPKLTMSDGGNLAAEIASQVVTRLVPQLTRAINAAFGAVVDKTVKKAVATATELVGAMVQRQSLLVRYKLDRQEQYSRRETIRVSGIVEEENETNEQLTESLLIWRRTVALI